MEKDRINGLVLAGGKSLRMGQDKSVMRWHGTEQTLHMAGLLKPLCQEVFISRRQGQALIPGNEYRVITDGDNGVGPYRAILSAFAFDPDTAWLVVACDLPLVDEQLLGQLVGSRDRSSIASAFISPFDGLPEPLITIWEPESYKVLLNGLAKDLSCPRKLLINSRNVNLLHAENADALLNVNTPVDIQRANIFLNRSDVANG